MTTLKGYAILAALAVPGFALAASESETNHPIGLANTLTISDSGSAEVDAVVGVNSGAAIVDLDFFTFSGREGDVVTLDIDGGAGIAGKRSVDTIIAVFGPAPAYQVLRQVDDPPAGAALDSGSVSRLDSIITNFRLPATGSYTVGVSSYNRLFVNGGGTVNTTLRSNPNGGYRLLISGVSPPLLQINIDIKPGSGDVAPINPKSRGKIPVALLGASDFTVQEVDPTSLTFGHSGDEASLAKCGEPTDVNGDAWMDLLCHFENQNAKFAATDDEAILRGELHSGTKFEGRGWLKVVPVKAQ